MDHFVGFIGTDDPRWEAVLGTLEHDFYQLPSYAAYCAERDGGHAEAFVYHGPDITVLIPLVFLFAEVQGKTIPYVSCPYGYPGMLVSPGADSLALASALESFRQCLKNARVVAAFVRLHPLQDVPMAALERCGTLLEHGQTVSIGLVEPLEQSWRGMRESHRRHIVAAREQGYTCHLGWEDLDEYLECHRQTMQRVAASERYAQDRRDVIALREALQYRLQLCTVRREGEVACAGLFSEVGGIIQYHLGGTKDAALQDSPSKLMFDYMRRWGHARGNRALHLGGGVGGQRDPLFHFKAGFSRHRHAFRTLRLVVDAGAYDAACAAAGVPSTVEGHFPAFTRTDTAQPVPGVPLRQQPAKATSDTCLHVLSAVEGTVELRWVGPQSLWARPNGRLSESLGRSYIERLRQLLAGREGVEFFIDATQLASYELAARDTLTAFLLSQRDIFRRIVLLNWPGGMSTVGRAGAQELGIKFELAVDRDDFGMRLRLAAPRSVELLASALPGEASAVVAAQLSGTVELPAPEVALGASD